ncbi:hypothetical protein BCR42DRAFT_407624 [Absidia repens]|uniref:Uncharacterized protein n=1 Tax=Absidia repens TaxID=90262 RepID=A0A1X2IU48_9FUNG|nr:hypothetical protein BCR42DRAFT_407624 [Absidia repens]
MNTSHKTAPRTSSSSSRTPNDILIHNTRKGPISTKQQVQRIGTAAERSYVKSTKLKNILVNGQEQEQLMKACGEGDLDKDLIRDTKLRSPLLIACASGHAEMVRLLVKFGADVNNPVGDIVGNRPMDLAVVANNFDTVLTLLELGAVIQRPAATKSSFSSNHGSGMDTNESKCPPPIPHRLGRTPLDLAQSRLNLLSQNDQSAGGDVVPQVIKIINLLKYYAKQVPSTCKATAPQSISATIPDPMQELDELTAKLSTIGLQESNRNQEKDLIKDLGDVISKLQL